MTADPTRERSLAMDYLELREEIVTSAARAIWVQWWADQCSCGNDAETCRLGGDGDPDWDSTVEHIPNDPGGVELMDIAPPIPDAAMECAERFIAMIEGRNEAYIATLLSRSLGLSDGLLHHYDRIRESEASDWGHYLAMTALGHGVAWTDHYPTPQETVYGPDIGFYGDSWEVCPRLTQELVRGAKTNG